MNSEVLTSPKAVVTNRVDVAASLRGLMAYVEARDFQGYDPYDALNSPLLRNVGRLGKYSRIAVIQFLKKCPVNLRPLLGVRKGHNPKGLGLFVGGYGKLQGIQSAGEFSDQITYLMDALDDCRSPNCSGHGWGYNFDWQSRAFFVPKYTPTIVNSAFVGHGLLDLYQAIGEQKALDLALPIAEFILKDLPRIHRGDGFCFSYTPLMETPVHNANLLGASILIRLNRFLDSTPVRDAAMAALKYSMELQRADGSWWYAEPKYQNWIDSFHTGFNLQAIDYFFREDEAIHYRPAFERGVDFYEENFFLPDGTAKYFHDRIGVLDVHSYAQGIVTFSRLGGRYLTNASQLVDAFVERFQNPRGYFYFQKTNHYTNRISYMRWAQSWAFHALTEYLAALDQNQKDTELC